MKIIGITGGTGAGKTTVLNYLQSHGAVVIDCDALYHEMLAANREMLAAIDNRFPGTVKNGNLDTKALGALVFKDKAALDDLNALTHEYVRAEVLRIILEEREQGRKLLAIDAIALIESGLGDYCHRIVAVIADREVRCRRIMARDNITMEYANSRIDAQKSNEYFIENCDVIIENNFDELSAFSKECSEIINTTLNDISEEEEF